MHPASSRAAMPSLTSTDRRSGTAGLCRGRHGARGAAAEVVRKPAATSWKRCSGSGRPASSSSLDRGRTPRSDVAVRRRGVSVRRGRPTDPPSRCTSRRLGRTRVDRVPVFIPADAHGCAVGSLGQERAAARRGQPRRQRRRSKDARTRRRGNSSSRPRCRAACELPVREDATRRSNRREAPDERVDRSISVKRKGVARHASKHSGRPRADPGGQHAAWGAVIKPRGHARGCFAGALLVFSSPDGGRDPGTPDVGAVRPLLQAESFMPGRRVRSCRAHPRRPPAVRVLSPTRRYRANPILRAHGHQHRVEVLTVLSRKGRPSLGRMS